MAKKVILTQETDEGYKSYLEVWEKNKHFPGISSMMTYDEFVLHRKKFIKKIKAMKKK